MYFYVENIIRNEKVASSNPASGTRRSSQGIFAIPVRTWILFSFPHCLRSKNPSFDPFEGFSILAGQHTNPVIAAPTGEQGDLVQREIREVQAPGSSRSGHCHLRWRSSRLHRISWASAPWTVRHWSWCPQGAGHRALLTSISYL